MGGVSTPIRRHFVLYPADERSSTASPGKLLQVHSIDFQRGEGGLHPRSTVDRRHGGSAGRVCGDGDAQTERRYRRRGILHSFLFQHQTPYPSSHRGSCWTWNGLTGGWQPAVKANRRNPVLGGLPRSRNSVTPEQLNAVPRPLRNNRQASRRNAGRSALRGRQRAEAR
jgi:hypothetical protein